MMTTMAACSARCRWRSARRRLRAAPAARHRHRRRAAGLEPAAHALHDAGGLPRPRPPARGWRRRRAAPSASARLAGARDEPRTRSLRAAPQLRSLPGCLVGPEYAAAGARAAAFKEVDGWKSGRRATPQDAHRGRMVEMFGDPELDALESGSTSRTRTCARPRIPPGAGALRLKARAALFPNVTSNASITRQRCRPPAPTRRSHRRPRPHTFCLIAASGSSTCGAACAGRVEAGQRRLQASAADLESGAAQLQAEVAADYFQLRALDAERALLRARSPPTRSALELTTNRYRAGVAAAGDVAQAETQLESTRAQAIDLGVQRAQLEQRSPSLVGEPPSTFSIAPAPLARRAARDSGRRCRRSCSSAGPTSPRPSARRRGERADRRRDSRVLPDADALRRRGLSSSRIARLAHRAEPLLVARAVAGADDLRRRRAARRPTRRSRRTTRPSPNYRQTVLAAFQEVEDNLAALRILEEEAQGAAGGRRRGAPIGGDLPRISTRRRRQLYSCHAAQTTPLAERARAAASVLAGAGRPPACSW